MSDRPAFADVLASVAGVEGWMTDDQACRLYDRAADLGAGARIVEIGSFRGRSLIVLASSAVDGVEIVSIDPHAGSDRGPQEIAADQDRGDDDHSIYNANLSDAGVRDRVDHVRKMSDDALDDVSGDVDLLYIDGAHRLGPARADIVDWGNKVSGGGVMLIHEHDFYAQGPGWSDVYWTDKRQNKPPFDLTVRQQDHKRYPDDHVAQTWATWESLVAYAAQNMRVVTSRDIIAAYDAQH